MASKTIGQVPPVNMNLKHAFENAVRDIYHADVKQKGAAYRTPIFKRSAVPSESSENLEKKALSEAAKALAQLWKVSTGR